MRQIIKISLKALDILELSPFNPYLQIENGPEGPLNSLSARRIWIVTVAIFVTNLTIRTVNDQLGMLVT